MSFGRCVPLFHRGPSGFHAHCPCCNCGCCGHCISNGRPGPFRSCGSKVGVWNGTSKNVGLGKVWPNLVISEAFLMGLGVSNFFADGSRIFGFVVFFFPFGLQESQIHGYSLSN